MFSLLDQSFTTVHVAFGTGSLLPPGEYDVTIESVEIHTPWQGEDPRLEMRMKQPARGKRPQSYVYKVPKAWDVKAGQHLVVLDPGGDLAVVNVLRVDEAPDIDVDANFDYKWAVSKVDTTEYLALNKREKEFGGAMLEVERVKQRENLLESFRSSLPEGSEARKLFEQTTASLSAPTVEPQSPPSAPQS
jgi:hypothetical protein